MTRTFTVAIMAAIMYHLFRDSAHGGYEETADAARQLYDAVRQRTE